MLIAIVTTISGKLDGMLHVSSLDLDPSKPEGRIMLKEELR